LLEEPQAALYAWVEASGDRWRQHVHPGDVILVVDVGGGTSDFSLIAVGESQGRLSLERLAVGDHILLGGDNIDLALAHVVATRAAGFARPTAILFNGGVFTDARAPSSGEANAARDRAPPVAGEALAADATRDRAPPVAGEAGSADAPRDRAVSLQERVASLV